MPETGFVRGKTRGVSDSGARLAGGVVSFSVGYALAAAGGRESLEEGFHFFKIVYVSEV